MELDGALDHDGTTVGFYGTAPVGQYSGNTTGTLTNVGAGTPMKYDDDTYDGGLAGSAYNIQDIVAALIKIGILAP